MIYADLHDLLCTTVLLLLILLRQHQTIVDKIKTRDKEKLTTIGRRQRHGKILSWPLFSIFISSFFKHFLNIFRRCAIFVFSIYLFRFDIVSIFWLISLQKTKSFVYVYMRLENKVENMNKDARIEQRPSISSLFYINVIFYWAFAYTCESYWNSILFLWKVE